MWIWITGTVVVIIVIVLSSSIKIRLTLIREDKDDEISFDARFLFGLLRKRIAIPSIQFNNLIDGVKLESEYIDANEKQLISAKEEQITTKTIKESFDNALSLFKGCFRLHEWLVDTISHVRCTQFRWRTQVGIGDAPETALATGMIWGLKSTMLGFLTRFIKLDVRPEIQVLPRYNESKFSTDVLVVLQIRMVHIAIAGCQLLYRIVKVKGGLRTWRRVLFKS
ncbi:DUF2953 domain-containing protein [Paenibacillus agricola]|uniref:DUF2953 domain-containing protein n=1 Tax=Paenibacillus agricola TaxID=2716264 RepID=A0ABX0IXU0_9BACL|nr:DUF2953 domain-containing protein [Paenibacillus agricola]NHN28769.1 DUF2953 domain-containing protein [Paenibacillus agricola]